MKSPTTIRIRPARKEDAPQIARVHVITWQFAYRGQMPDDYLDSLSIDQRAAWWEKNLGEGNLGTTLVAEDDSGIAGFVSVGPGPEDGIPPRKAELYAIYVAPDSMGSGIGYELLKAGIATLRNQGFTEARLWVLTSNEKTRRFYERFGWQMTGETKAETGGEQMFHETRYCLHLNRINEE